MEKHVEIAGKAYRLCYCMNALCRLEEKAGGTLEQMMSRQFSAVRLLLWAALLRYQPETTIEGAGEIIDAHLARGGHLEEIVEMCAEALEEAGFFGA